MLNIFSCAFWPSVCLLWRNIYLYLLTILNWIAVFFWYKAVWDICMFWRETLQARGEWQDIFKVLEDRKAEPRILYPGRLSFRFYGEIKSWNCRTNACVDLIADAAHNDTSYNICIFCPGLTLSCNLVPVE